jgi:hypothetical protein
MAVGSRSAFLRRMASRVSKSGRLDVGDEAPLEAGAEPVLERGDRLRRAVRADDDLLVGAVQLVEVVEELLLEPLLALHELDVVDEQHVDLAVLALELTRGVRADGVDEVVEVRLGRDVADGVGRVVLPDVVGDGVEQVRLAQARHAVDEQRVVGPRRGLGHREGSGVGEAVGAPGHEAVEGVAGVERRSPPCAVPDRRWWDPGGSGARCSPWAPAVAVDL